MNGVSLTLSSGRRSKTSGFQLASIGGVAAPVIELDMVRTSDPSPQLYWMKIVSEYSLVSFARNAISSVHSPYDFGTVPPVLHVPPASENGAAKPSAAALTSPSFASTPPELTILSVARPRWPTG